jgi:hypothetical protein
MNRDVPEGRDSGWVFYEADSKESNSGHCSLYEISTKNPGVVPFLSLPPATLILFSKTEIEISLGGRMISSKSNEFLKKILDSRVFGASCFS